MTANAASFGCVREGLTQREIGSLLGVSQMQVSRIMRAALRKLLDAVQGRAPEPAS
jgi:DNA-directed RNA polymerase specialized sigma subunit